jgi:hypothetical protein
MKKNQLEELRIPSQNTSGKMDNESNEFNSNDEISKLNMNQNKISLLGFRSTYKIKTEKREERTTLK